jgi:diketogulonate reductase-like aldo/keto reductase
MQLELLLSRANVKPQFVQNRCFAVRGWDLQVRQVCQNHGITYQGFSLLTANQEIWHSRRVAEIGNVHNLSAAQIIFCLAMDLGILPLTGTSNASHMADDLVCKPGILTSAEVRELAPDVVE